MSYDSIRTNADSAPLANALAAIANIVDQSESDPEQMVEMLNQIDEAVAQAREAWMANVRAEQEDELTRLRALANK